MECGLFLLVMLSTERPPVRQDGPTCPRASCLMLRVPHLRLSLLTPRASRYAPPHLAPPARLALRTAKVRPPHHDIELRAGVKLRVNKRPHWGQQVDEHMLQPYVSCVYVCFNVSSECCKSRSGVAYVATTIRVCCKCMFQCFSCFKRMLQAFYLDGAYVALAIYVC
jgi:hypothetical protein